jgi:hypothetical protein
MLDELAPERSATGLHLTPSQARSSLLRFQFGCYGSPMLESETGMLISPGAPFAFGLFIRRLTQMAVRCLHALNTFLR